MIRLWFSFEKLRSKQRFRFVGAAQPQSGSPMRAGAFVI